MGKVLLLVVLAFVAYALWRSVWSKAKERARMDDERPESARAEPARSIGGERMVSCARCGVHLPLGEAIRIGGSDGAADDRDARFYCSREHVPGERP